jgi:flagellar motor component MotA
MARNVCNYAVMDEGRDKGKIFVLTEMPASRAESWAMRALLALMAGGVEMPEGFERMGMAAMAEVGIKALAGLKWEVAEPLLEEMWTCIKIMPDASKPHLVRNLLEEDVEEITTRVKLRAEVWKLHTGFLKAVANSISGDSPATATKKVLQSM